ncbi:MAG: cardiolipin synthase [Desulfovibrio sp.]|nr:cardiolipin synthase [Desulfovibrio sp.]
MTTLDIIALATAHLLSLVAAGNALLTKRDPRAALGWTAALIFLPVAGLVIYLIFGIGRAQSRAEKIMRRYSDISGRYAQVEDRLKDTVLPTPEARDLDKLSRALSGLPLCGGNSITPLHNGDEAYPAMLEAIDAARNHVFLGTYIFNYGVAAKKFITALDNAHKRGVDVRVLVDGVGSLYSWRKPVEILARLGVRTTRFRPLTLFPPNLGINLRSHRKILVCDNIAFTGGMNISDGNLIKLDKPEKGRIQDVQFRCEGPIVSELRRAFLLNWSFCTGEFTPLPPLAEAGQGTCACRVVIDGPGDDADALYDIICGAVNMAHKTVTIMTPYFLPPSRLMAALRSAGQRGVDVRIILPGHNNLAFMSWGIERILPELLQAGVRVWHQAPPFAHTKLLAVDGFYSLVGSANMDSRSLLLNFELDMEIYDKAFHDRLAAFMLSTLAKGREVTLKELQTLSLPARLRNAAVWVFSPYL